MEEQPAQKSSLGGKVTQAPSSGCSIGPLVCWLEQPPRQLLTARWGGEPHLIPTSPAFPQDLGARHIQDTLIKTEKYVTGDLAPLATMSATAPLHHVEGRLLFPLSNLIKTLLHPSCRSCLPRAWVALNLGLILQHGLSSVLGAGYGPAHLSRCVIADH